MIFFFLLLLKPALECVEAKKYYHFWAVFPAFFLDVFIAHTTWALVFGMPRKGEWTISDTLERIITEYADPRIQLAIEIAREINKVSPTKDHIRALVKLESLNSVIK